MAFRQGHTLLVSSCFTLRHPSRIAPLLLQMSALLEILCAAQALALWQMQEAFAMWAVSHMQHV